MVDGDGSPAEERKGGPAGHGMLLHAFTHRGVPYEVRFAVVDGRWFASLCVAGSEHRRPLCPWPDDVPSDLSPHAVRSGLIAVSEWLVKTERWLDAETRSLLAERAQPRLAA